MLTYLKAALIFAASCIAAIAASFTFTATPAHAKQCIWNKGAYILNVSWYRSSDVYAPRVTGSSERLRAIAPAVHAKSLAAGNGSCTETNDPLVAVITVVGCAFFKYKEDLNAGDLKTRECGNYILVQRGIGVLRNLDWNKIISPLNCSNVNYAYCESYWWNAPDKQGGSPLMIVSPSTSHYLDFWGSVFDVQWGQGGPIH